ncbi:type II toxin-antitoxin system HipA family toxin [Bosea sp. RAC05]|uniref:type II toxin-antitoxin system HipA family toxin n=1 Tax=Bosea sp. RAC05 TaxID=1842539 RepID=UPI00083D6646|nr:type II toxin-antitoxin system HipA family toxin [Bosea sp. RAC05]AOG03299.1 hypothetical protein BSY19_4955 [Bosea sp. RAC05]
MLRVWAGKRPVGLLDRHGAHGATFVYDEKAQPGDAISLTMPVRTASWDHAFGIHPIFEMNLPEGALRAELNRRFAKATGRFSDLDLLGVVGRSQIGRLRFTAPDSDLDENVPLQSVDEILRARRGGELYDYLVAKFAVHSGLSGVQPKVMIRGEEDVSAPRKSDSVKGATHIVKFWDKDEYAELAANEFFCLEAARRIGLQVPGFSLADDGSALIVERFDLRPEGTYNGFEDFCVLNGVGSDRKYEGGYEARLFKRTREFVGGAGRSKALHDLFKLFVLNCAIQNGDAHAKNFALLYDLPTGAAALAPVYDLITTTAYLPADKMALTLNGTTAWPSAQKLTQLGQTRADVSLKQINEMFEQIADTLAELAPAVRTYFADRSPEIGERILAAWSSGVSFSLGRTRSWSQGASVQPEEVTEDNETDGPGCR